MKSPMFAVLENRLSDIEEIRARLSDKLDLLIKQDRLLEREEEIVRDALESFRSMES
jgi:hypothetical protein